MNERKMKLIERFNNVNDKALKLVFEAIHKNMTKDEFLKKQNVIEKEMEDILSEMEILKLLDQIGIN